MRYEDIHITETNHTILGKVKSFGVHKDLGTVLILQNGELVLINGFVNFQSEMSDEVLREVKKFANAQANL